MAESKLFQRNRALGYVSNHVPLVTRYIHRRKENLVVTCVGKTFHTYGCSHFSLLSVSPTHTDDITCMSADAYHVYTSSDKDIFAWRRGSELKHTYRGHEAPVYILLPFGAHLISVDESGCLKIWDVKAEDEILELNFDNAVFRITALIHPNAYLNKILLGSDQGQLQLWNAKHGKMIHIFKGWGVPVAVLRQAPAIDVVAVGLTSGKVVLHNLKYDETLFELIQDWGAITAIAFRTDGYPLMATGSTGGHIVFWNLEEKRVESQLIDAHFTAVTGLEFLPNEPLIVSSSPDNSLKLWIFDVSDGAARLLRIREGHGLPPTSVRFYGNDGANILSAGEDSSLRIYSTITETFNKSLGRASFNRKASKKKNRAAIDPLIMPPIMEFAYETTREKEWNNIVAKHLGIATVTTWSYDRLKMGDLKLLPEKFRGKSHVTATALCLSPCGNFAVIGYNGGSIERFNVQSGIHRSSYGSSEGGHVGPVTGIMVDSLNQTVISAGRDCTLKFWNFKGATEPRVTMKFEDPIEWIRGHRENSLLAVALENFVMILVDVDSKKTVRRFEGHTARLTDATFNPDARWLVTASMDCTIRTWHVPTSRSIDLFEVSEACTSLHFSRTGQYLVTAHSCTLGVYLWCNRSLFAHVSLKALSIGSTSKSDSEGSEEFEEYETSEQLHGNLITTSSLSDSRWRNLLNMSIVKERNKPKELTKQPAEAPFFLPVIPSLELRFDLSEKADSEKTDRSNVPSEFHDLTKFARLLRESKSTEEYLEAMTALMSLSPSSIDFEIHSLALDPNSSTQLLLQFLKMIKFTLERNRYFELAQAYLGLFLKVHGEAIVEKKMLRRYLTDIRKVQEKSWTLLREKLFYNLSVVQHLKKS